MRTPRRLAFIATAVTLLLVATAGGAAETKLYVTPYVEEVTIAAGQSQAFTIELQVSGTRSEVVTATVYQTWTLQENGTFSGSDPTTVTFPPGNYPEWAYVTGRVVVPAERSPGSYPLTITPHESSDPFAHGIDSTPVLVTVQGTSLYAFEGFGPPVATDMLNTVKAGQTVPLRWRLLDPAGAPVTDLASASVAVRTVSCSGTLPADPVEEVAAGQSGLQNLGDGDYQFNWKTTKPTGCRELQLTLPYQFRSDEDVPTLQFELR
jgi:hypothetical protein